MAQSFLPTFEVFGYSVVFIVGLQTTLAFGERYVLRKKTALNSTALLASVLTLFYTLYGLIYWFNGINNYRCVSHTHVLCVLGLHNTSRDQCHNPDLSFGFLVVVVLLDCCVLCAAVPHCRL